ncbi:calcium-binding protein [Pseudoroseomonas cervicalis]|uniref:calcium-binding protein n=1 Tax=Teichococcus cervicalis TaxID=204525 RepID=UPI00277E437C|nr:hypothetical protein [Pseudoroseomonas cervicalis]MDQ1079448.1 hypothetical protein [Pseudoroseomonas cervicalis]
MPVAPERLVKLELEDLEQVLGGNQTQMPGGPQASEAQQQAMAEAALALRNAEAANQPQPQPVNSQEMKDRLTALQDKQDGIPDNTTGPAITGTAGHDSLRGTAGNDLFRDGNGVDYMHGGAGDDVFISNTGDRFSDQAFGEAGNDTYVWSPGSGHDSFDGGQGQDTLILRGVDPSAAMQGLRVEGGGNGWFGGPQGELRLADGVITFVNQQGQPQSFSGTLQIGGEILRFQNVEQIFARR